MQETLTNDSLKIQIERTLIFLKTSIMDDYGTKNVLILIVAVAVTFIITWFIFGNNNNDVVVEKSHNGPGRISGEIIFNALTPEQTDNGAIIFAIRTHNTGAIFAPATMSLKPSFTNGGAWIIDGLEEGISYDVQATLMIDDEEIVQSHIATVTAPASDVDLALTITWSDLPQSSIKSSRNKIIAGTLAVQGYIPDGAMYAIFTAPARDNSHFDAGVVDDPQFTRAVNLTLATTDNDWSWGGALTHVDYRVRAELYSAAGDYIGTSNIVDAAVPQSNVALIIQSEAVTEPVKIPISGHVLLNGGYKSDSTVIIQVREDGADGYFDVDSFPAESNRDWVYGDAKAGIHYDVRAILDRKGEEQARSSQKQLTAPAKDIQLIINTNLDLDDPAVRPEIVMCDDKDNHKYDATIKFPGVDSARAYWLRIGKVNNGGDRFNELEEPDHDGDSVEITIRIDENRYYYADYAYSYCSDCDTLDSYSDFSSSLKFYCGDEPDED